jgi:hypothetical protein
MSSATSPARADTPMRHRRSWSLIVVCLVAVGLAIVAAGCTEREATTERGPLPVAPTAHPNPSQAEATIVRKAPQDVQELLVDVSNGRFSSDRYAVQSRPIRLRVTTGGGAYTLSIDRLLEPRVLPPNTTTEIALTVPDPGDYTMRITGAAEDTAVLNVRLAGSR